MDYRELLLIDRTMSGGIRDNDYGFEGAQGAYVVTMEGDAILHIQLAPRVVLPRFEVDAGKASGLVDSLLWAVARNREVIPDAAPGSLVETLQGQNLAIGGVRRLFAKPGTPAWDRALAEKGDLPLVESLGDWGDFWPDGTRIVLGLPCEEELGVSWQPSDSVQGLLVFPRFVAAVRV